MSVILYVILLVAWREALYCSSSVADAMLPMQAKTQGPDAVANEAPCCVCVMGRKARLAPV